MPEASAHGPRGELGRKKTKNNICILVHCSSDFEKNLCFGSSLARKSSGGGGSGGAATSHGFAVVRTVVIS
jgi:hypothetical protein